MNCAAVGKMVAGLSKSRQLMIQICDGKDTIEVLFVIQLLEWRKS